MWHLSLPWWEFVLRALVVYAFLLFILRLTGKRQIGQMSPFDLVLLLILSNAVQNSMNGGDNTLLGGLISASALIVCNGLVGWLTYRSRTAEGWLDGAAEVIIYNGRVVQAAADRLQLSHEELMGALRMGGCETVEEVHLATVENNGQISVIKTETGGATPHVHRARFRRRGRDSGY